MRRATWLLLAGLSGSLLSGCDDLGDEAGGASVEAVSFSQDLQPILQANCTVCHVADGSSGGLDLTSRAGLLAGGQSGGVVVSGQPDSSLLVLRISSTEAGERMPPGGSLGAAQIELIRTWIEEGLADN